MRSKPLLISLAVGLVIAIAGAWYYQTKLSEIAGAPTAAVSITPAAIGSSAPQPTASNVASAATGTTPAPAASSLAPAASGTPVAAAAAPAPAASGVPAPATPAVDLTVDASGLSKATVVLETSKGRIKFKLYAQDAPNTVARIVQLIQQKFYDGLAFHRVVPGFVIQGGDPLGNGTGGSGQKLKAEFNKRRHLEGTVAMARAADPDSADSQFYISLGMHPHLDSSYTVFGQVTEGMDTVRKIAVGDKMLSVRLE